MEDNYDDIINLPHHESRKHRRMPMLNRAAQFAPFAALTGYGDAIHETARTTETMMDLESDAVASLDNKLSLLRQELNKVKEQDPKGTVRLSITYFQTDRRKNGGSYTTVTIEVKEVDDTFKTLLLADGKRIPIPDIVDIGISEEIV